jgi:hypothetical protein
VELSYLRPLIHERTSLSVQIPTPVPRVRRQACKTRMRSRASPQLSTPISPGFEVESSCVRPVSYLSADKHIARRQTDPLTDP